MEADNLSVEAKLLISQIDRLDYYQILQVDPHATAGQVRQAYHEQSRKFHPDRYFHLPESQFKESVYTISKRVAEAYVVLRDAQKRRFYDQQLQQSQHRILRYTEQSEKAQKQAKSQEIGTTEAGMRNYRQGMIELKRKNFTAAARSFKTALACEPGNETFKRMAEEANAQIKTDYTVK
jgi:curved DNA-binding protein CbpA